MSTQDLTNVTLCLILEDTNCTQRGPVGTFSRKKRLNPSKLLVLLLYGSYPYMKVEQGSNDLVRITLTLGKFAKLMRVRKSHVVEYLDWLDKMQYISIVDNDNKEATVTIAKPNLFKAV